MITYVKGSSVDAEDIVEFADYVFSQAHEPHDFQSLLPKLYKDGKATQKFHYIIKEDGKIRAMIGAFPMKMQIGEEVVKFAGIGTVSVHPKSRGEGYMKKLLDWVSKDLLQEGMAFSVLGGQRQRYAYYGYEPTGTAYRFTLTKTNVRHVYKGVDQYKYQWKQLTKDDSMLELVYQLYQKKEVKVLREKADFYDILCSWRSVPYVLLKQGSFCGYVCLKGGSVDELELENEQDFSGICKFLLEEKKLDYLQFNLSPLETKRIAELVKVSEAFQIVPDYQFCIHDYYTLIKVCLIYKSRVNRLQDGIGILEIRNYTCLWIQVKENKVEIKEITQQQKEEKEKELDPSTSLSLSAPMATQIIFSPAATMGFLSLPEWFKNWFPLSLFLSSQDAC